MTIEEVRKAIDDNDPPYIIALVNGPFAVTFDFARMAQIAREVLNIRDPHKVVEFVQEQFQKVKEKLDEIFIDKMLVIADKQVILPIRIDEENQNT